MEPEPDRLRPGAQLRVDVQFYWVQQMFARNIGDKVLSVTASTSGLYYSATLDSESGMVFLKIVNPGAQDVPGQLTFGGRDASVASIEVLSNAEPQAGNTLASPTAVLPSRATLQGSNGVFSYQVPANSLTVVTLAPGR